MFAHMKQNTSLSHGPYRQLVHWSVADGTLHAFCNILPFLVEPKDIVATKSFVWLPARVLSHQEFVKCILKEHVYVSVAKRSSMQRGPPPSNLLFVLASRPSASPDTSRVKHSDHAFWVPQQRDIGLLQTRYESLGVDAIGFPRVLFDVLSKQIDGYGDHFCALFSQSQDRSETIDAARTDERKISLESIEKDAYAIPQEQCVRATVHGMRQFSTVLLNGYCGSGKTVMMIETICRLGTKTAILVNKQDLAHQWEDRIRTFAPKLRTKIVHGTQGDMDDCDIVIFLIQSLFSRS